MDYFNGIRSNVVDSVASGLLGQAGNALDGIRRGDLSALASYVKNINTYDIPGAPEHARAARQKAYADLHDAMVSAGYVPRHAARLIEMAGGGALGSMGFGSGEMRDIPNVGNHYGVGDLRTENEARWGVDPFQRGEQAQRQISDAAARNDYLPKAPYSPATVQPPGIPAQHVPAMRPEAPIPSASPMQSVGYRSDPLEVPHDWSRESGGPTTPSGRPSLMPPTRDGRFPDGHRVWAGPMNDPLDRSPIMTRIPQPSQSSIDEARLEALRRYMHGGF